MGLSTNSVQKAERLLKIVKSRPEEMAVEHVFEQVKRVENARSNAEQYGEHLDIVQQNKEQIARITQELHDLKSTKN